MFCIHCGASLPDGTTFCTNCGKPVAPPCAPIYAPPPPPPKKSMPTWGVVLIVVGVVLVIVGLMIGTAAAFVNFVERLTTDVYYEDDGYYGGYYDEYYDEYYGGYYDNDYYDFEWDAMSLSKKG